MGAHGGCSTELHMQVDVGWTQTPMQSLWRAVEGVSDKAGCWQNQEAERGGWDPGYREVRT